MRGYWHYLIVIGLCIGASCMPVMASTSTGEWVMKNAEEEKTREIQKLEIVSSILDEHSSGFTKTERVAYSVIAMSGAVIAVGVAARITNKKQ